MRNPVKNTAQEKNSTLAVTAITQFQFQNYTLEEFQDFCQIVQPKAIRITTAKRGTEIRIQLFLRKGKGCFGRGASFQEAIKSLLIYMQSHHALA